jgi:dihydrofolate reductase
MNETADERESRIGLTAVVAIATNGVIGRDGDMPWRLSSDLRRFKQLTMGGALIMGRKTYDSIGRPLPGRQTIVITRNPDWSAAGVTPVASPAEAIAQLGDRNGFVVGGAEIYRMMLPACQRLMLTRVLAEIEGDTRLELDLSGFEVVERIDVPVSERDEYSTEFLELVRVAATDSVGGPTKN